MISLHRGVQLGSFLLVALFSGSCMATVRTYPDFVTPFSPCSTTLQACVDGSVAGDVINLATNIPISGTVYIDRSLVLQPAAGFSPSIEGVFAGASTSNVDVTIQRLNVTMRIMGGTGSGGGRLTLRVIDNVITSSYSGAIEVYDGGSGTQPYGGKTVVISGNRITQTGGAGSCFDAIMVAGTYGDVDATIVGNDITATELYQCGGIDVVVGAGRSGTALIDRNIVRGSNFDFGIQVRNYGANVGNPGGLMSATVTNNLVTG